jgi:hypothetical protein
MKRKLKSGEVVEWSDRDNDPVVVTRQKIVDALLLNGYEQGFHGYIQDNEEGKIESACALGQVGLNLGVGMDSLWTGMYDAAAVVVAANDTSRKPLKKIAALLKKEWKGRLEETVTLRFFDWSVFKNYQGIKIR